jgi:hypothetical protein
VHFKRTALLRRPLQRVLDASVVLPNTVSAMLAHSPQHNPPFPLVAFFLMFAEDDTEEAAPEAGDDDAAGT